jgi:hypothetical protein
MNEMKSFFTWEVAFQDNDLLSRRNMSLNANDIKQLFVLFSQHLKCEVYDSKVKKINKGL